MTIRIYEDRIEFDQYILRENGNGVGATLFAQLNASNFYTKLYQGTNSGFVAGSFPVTSTIESFPFASDTNATLYSNLSVAKGTPAGQLSETHGYMSGGYGPNPVAQSTGLSIDKFSFSSTDTASNIGSLSEAKYFACGQSSATEGYISGGTKSYPSPSTTYTDRIEKFPFASDSNSRFISTLGVPTTQSMGNSSPTHGYASGGASPLVTSNVRYFPFSNESSAVLVGQLTIARSGSAEQSSLTHGYVSGYFPGVSSIDKFQFSTYSISSENIGNLSVARGFGSAGHSSTTHGYTAGGWTPPSTDVIDKFPFAAGGTASSIGTLTAAKRWVEGTHY